MKKNIGILINFINDVITWIFKVIFEDFCFCCYSFLKLSFENILHLLLRKK